MNLLYQQHSNFFQLTNTNITMTSQLQFKWKCNEKNVFLVRTHSLSYYLHYFEPIFYFLDKNPSQLWGKAVGKISTIFQTSGLNNKTSNFRDTLKKL